MIDLGSLITTMRQEKGWSQKRLSKKVGVSHASISFYERNKVSPSFLTMEKICDVCGYEIVIREKDSEKRAIK